MPSTVHDGMNFMYFGQSERNEKRLNYIRNPAAEVTILQRMACLHFVIETSKNIFLMAVCTDHLSVSHILLHEIGLRPMSTWGGIK